ncbi:hypothetical protein [Saliphagus infecundisoli]|uniref:Uncharacterized protein n=1 Tax=Saliphagus infecundisoli TaxID=1849069 RepID=A0ABD5QBM9_9EURY|nr:hypothetical protein [Saliphagus infecundisoli]
MDDELGAFIDDNHIRLSHFIQDQIEEEKKREIRLLELEEMMEESEAW